MVIVPLDWAVLKEAMQASMATFLGDLNQLESSAEHLAKAVTFWNNAIIVFLALTALAAVGIFVSQRIAFKRADALADLQSQISEMKEKKSRQQLLKLQIAAQQASTAESEVEKQLAVQREKTANAERRLLELQDQLKPRIITPEATLRLIQMLQAVPKGSLEIQDLAIDNESKALGRELAILFTQSGWRVAVNDVEFLAALPKGLQLKVRDKDFPPARTAVVRSALLEATLEAKLIEDPKLGSDELILFVGVKP